jgi:molybdenum cofactor cytidylyltransferase
VGDIVTVVLGANWAAIQTAIRNDVELTVVNPLWQEGMGSSIRTGVSALLTKQPAIEEVIIMVADQPFVDAALLTALKEKRKETRKDIIACYYEERPGVPALFDARFFDNLLQLQGAEGAKKLFSMHHDSVAFVPFTRGNIDIDTMDDYYALREKDASFGKDFFNSWC